MNLTGTPFYSKELGAMRQPSNNVDTLKKLVFIYPMGIDQSIVNVPYQTFVKGDADTLGDLSRAFLAVSVLKEIFTSNTLNLITTASTYTDQVKSPPFSHQMFGPLLRGESSSAYETSYYNQNSTQSNPIDKNALQQKINERMKDIKLLLKSNPRLKKLNPFMQIITLENMLDVPVIVGSWPFQLDTASLFMFLSVAIATRTKLDNWGAVRKVFTKLETFDDNSLYQIFQVLQNVENNTKVPGKISSELLPGGIQTELDMLKNRIATEDNETKKAILINQLEDMKSNFAIKNINALQDTKMKELERMFMMMIDPERLVNKFGLRQDVGQSSYVAKKISPQTDLLFNRSRQQFVDFLTGTDSLFSSAYMIFAPITPVPGLWEESTKNYLSMKSIMINNIFDNYDSFFSNLKSEFDTTISDEISQSSLSVKNMNASCDANKEEFISLINLFNRTLSESQISPTFGLEDVQKFSNSIDKLTTKFSAVNKNLEDSLIQFFGKDNLARVKSAIITLVDNALDKFFTPFIATADPFSQMQARLFAINTTLMGTSYIQNPNINNNIQNNAYNGQQLNQGDLIVNTKTHQELLKTLAESTKLILETVFMLIFKMNLCDFVEVADVQFDIAKNDVLELPNYCLVLPIEVINALLILYTKRNWKDAVIKSGIGFNPLNPGNTKANVGLLAKQLGIPNLIVIDQKRQEFFYSFRYLGNQTEKLKLQAVDTFVKYHLQDKEEGISQIYY